MSSYYVVMYKDRKYAKQSIYSDAEIRKILIEFIAGITVNLRYLDRDCDCDTDYCEHFFYKSFRVSSEGKLILPFSVEELDTNDGYFLNLLIPDVLDLAENNTDSWHIRSVIKITATKNGNLSYKEY